MDIKILEPQEIITKESKASVSKLEVLETLCFPEEAWNLQQIVSHLSTHPTLVMGEYVGYCFFSINLWELEILRIGVSPEYRRQKLGRCILEELRNCYLGKEMILEVDNLNFPAISLYESFGFRLMGNRKNYYKSGNSALIYQYSNSNGI